MCEELCEVQHSSMCFFVSSCGTPGFNNSCLTVLSFTVTKNPSGHIHVQYIVAIFREEAPTEAITAADPMHSALCLLFRMLLLALLDMLTT